jgi:hypothetical protein
MNNTSIPDEQLFAKQYLSLGLQPLPLPHRKKAPNRPDWTNLRVDGESLPKYFAASPLNIGGLLGTASGGIVSIDCDWPEAGRLALHVLPKSWTFGRAGQIRHVLIRSPGAKTAPFDCPASLVATGKGRRIIEILSDGKQAMLPPSTHPNGQRVEWITHPDSQKLAALSAEHLLEHVQALAGAALLVRLWPDLEGSRHDVTLALAGSLYHAQWPIKRIQTLLGAILLAANDNEHQDRARAVIDTLKVAEAGKAITGLPRLGELLPADVIDRLKAWWKLGSSGPVLTFGGKPLNGHTWALPADDWPELLEFERVEYEPNSSQPYPTERLGRLLEDAVKAIVDRQQAPHALAAQSVLASCSTVVQGYFDVNCDGRIIPLSLWLALIGEPGERKTSSDDLAFSRLYLRMREAQQRYSIALESWKAARSNKDEGDPGPRPRNPCWLLRDATAEGLIKHLDRHWPALCLTNSDAAAWLNGYSMREGRDSATAATLSALWSGSFHAQARASMDEPSVLHNRRLSLSLMLQPELAAQLCESQTLAGQGFLSRCLPAFPPSTIGTRKYQRAQSDPRLDQFYSAQDRLLLNPPNMVLETGELKPEEITLTDDALNAWIEHHDHFERELIGEYQSIRQVANKCPEQILRLAGVRAALDGAGQIAREHIEDAAVLLHWYCGEWLAMSSRLVAHRRDVDLPKQLLDWMVQRRLETGQSVFNLREVYRSGPRMVRNKADQARELMAELLRRGYVRPSGKDYALRPEGEL